MLDALRDWWAGRPETLILSADLVRSGPLTWGGADLRIVVGDHLMPGQWFLVMRLPWIRRVLRRLWPPVVTEIV